MRRTSSRSDLPVLLTITNLGAAGGTASGAPSNGTPDYGVFNGYVDFGTGAPANHSILLYPTSVLAFGGSLYYGMAFGGEVWRFDGGFGLTNVLAYKVADHLREGRLKTVLGDFEPPALPVHVLHREGRHATPKARTFIDLAVERLRPRLAAL